MVLSAHPQAVERTERAHVVRRLGGVAQRRAPVVCEQPVDDPFALLRIGRARDVSK